MVSRGQSWSSRDGGPDASFHYFAQRRSSGCRRRQSGAIKTIGLASPEEASIATARATGDQTADPSRRPTGWFTPLSRPGASVVPSSIDDYRYTLTPRADQPASASFLNEGVRGLRTPGAAAGRADRVWRGERATQGRSGGRWWLKSYRSARFENKTALKVTMRYCDRTTPCNPRHDLTTGQLGRILHHNWQLSYYKILNLIFIFQ